MNTREGARELSSKETRKRERSGAERQPSGGHTAPTQTGPYVHNYRGGRTKQREYGSVYRRGVSTQTHTFRTAGRQTEPNNRRTGGGSYRSSIKVDVSI